MLVPFDALSAPKPGRAAGLTGGACCAVQGNTLDELYTAIQTQEHEYPVCVPIRCSGRANSSASCPAAQGHARLVSRLLAMHSHGLATP